MKFHVTSEDGLASEGQNAPSVNDHLTLWKPLAYMPVIGDYSLIQVNASLA